MNYAKAFNDHTGDATEVIADHFENESKQASSIIQSDDIVNFDELVSPDSFLVGDDYVLHSYKPEMPYTPTWNSVKGAGVTKMELLRKRLN